MSKVLKSDLNILKDSLFYLKVTELKSACLQLNLPTTGKKGDLVQRIIIFLEEGKILNLKSLPEISKAKAKQDYPLKPNTLILSGNYKNDLKTRQFFKKLIGDHFHFTAFGQDWIKEQWMKGKPPTYAEFAKYWQNEYLKRKSKKAQPKQEWAYISFIQRYLEKNPNASKTEITREWEMARLEHVKKVEKILAKI